MTSPQRNEASDYKAVVAEDAAPLASDLEIEIAQGLIDDGARDAATHSRSVPGRWSRSENLTIVRSSTARTMRDWLSDPDILRPPFAVLPHLALQGRVTLLSGREKVGKSTLLASAVASASRGQTVLGQPIAQPVRTLWYAIDEHVADAVRRFESLGVDMDCVMLNEVPRTESEVLAALELDLATHPEVALVVVDTLSRIFDASNLDTNSSHDVGPVIARLVDLFHCHNVAAVLLYHTGKNGREYRGSTALGATVDDILTLRRREDSGEDDFDEGASDDGRRLLVQEGRYLRGRLQLSCSSGLYQLHDETRPARTRVLDALRDHGSTSNRSELSKLAEVRKATGLQVIADLIREGVVIEHAGLLKLAPSDPAKLGSQPPATCAPAPSAELSLGTTEFPGSLAFPVGGTGQKDDREPPSSSPRVPVPVSSTPSLRKWEPESAATIGLGGGASHRQARAAGFVEARVAVLPASSAERSASVAT